ncbi:MAG: YigZ family protein [Bacteroidota bacterium]|nr:YigZ family protein [Bacteroidota bacterium]
MNKIGSYKTISEPAEGFYKEKGSRFISFAYRLDSELEVKNILEKLKKKYHDARHHCYAYKLGPDNPRERVNDDGEPSGTAGRPILGQINSYQLNHILIVVVRYFGGTLLGSSGLYRAFKASASNAIENATIIQIDITKDLLIHFKYPELNQVLKILKDEKLKPQEYSYELNCEIKVAVPVNIYERITKNLGTIKSVRIIEQ